MSRADSGWQTLGGSKRVPENLDEPKIDLNRGVLKAWSGRAGEYICMYYDDPGVFLDLNGQPRSEDDARSAGFPVERLAADRRKRDRIRKAHAEIDALQREELARIMAAAEADEGEPEARNPFLSADELGAQALREFPKKV